LQQKAKNHQAAHEQSPCFDQFFMYGFWGKPIDYIPSKMG
jgi:hypothetical protein